MSNKPRRTNARIPATAPSDRSTASYVPLLVGGSLVGLGLGLWLLGVVWPVAANEGTALGYGGMVGLFSGLLGASAIAGSQVMTAGRRLAWFSPVAGILFTVGFTGLVLASAGSDSAPWMLIGITGLGACVIWFYAIGMITGRIPPLFLNRYGTWAAPVIGVVLTVVGAMNGLLELLALGVLTIAAWVGILLGSILLRRGRPTSVRR